MSYRADEYSTDEADSVLDERELVLRAQGGELRAFEILYERYHARISRYLTRMVGDDGVADELSQETFRNAWEALLTLHDPARFTSWLYRLATRHASQYQNHIRLIRTNLWEEERASAANLRIAHPEKRSEETELIKQVLTRVSPTYRPCFILYVIEKWPPEQIADVLGIAPTTVANYISRGQEEFRQIYYRMIAG